MFVLILSIISTYGDEPATVLAHDYSSKETCYEAGRTAQRQHKTRGHQISWSCTPK